MNESANVAPLTARIAAAVAAYRVEVIFVDDSLDALTEEQVAMARRLHCSSTFDIQMLHRTGVQRWGGLSGAVSDGMDMARSDRILVMDGDLQHPPETIPAMIEQAYKHDVVIASRYRTGGSAGGLDGMVRHLVSRGSTMLAKLLFPRRLRCVTDPMTGFFLINRAKLQRELLRPKGFKILLEMLATHPSLTRTEVPLQFAERLAGESHGNMKQGVEFLMQLANLRFGLIMRQLDRLPKMVLFGAIGGSVFVLGMALLYIMVDVLKLSPLLANAVQLGVTFWLNYVLNRRITWRERNVSRKCAYKFLISRGATTVMNYLLFALLINLQFQFSLAGRSFDFSLHYIAVNVVTLAVIMAVNYRISDRWAFAEEAETALGRKQRKPAGVPLALTLAGMFVGILIMTIIWTPATILPILLAVSSVALFLQASIEVWRMLYSYREPGSVDKLRFPAAPTDGLEEKFSVIVPARHESETLAHTLNLLAKQSHPNVDIYTVICDDDEDTLAVARSVVENQERVHLIVYPLAAGTKPSKPLQLNYVLEQTEAEDHTVVGVFDAEDTVHPDLLKHIEAAFRDKSIDVVQGGVQLMNFDSSWYSLHNVLEYYRWFNSAMAYNADKQFMPLGGNTVFVRADKLRAAGGWPVTLTEDCSLGVLLSTRFGSRTAVYYDPMLATQEETPDTLQGLFKQRVRWNQGFFHEWRKGIWLELPSLRQRLLAGYVLLSPLLLAIISIFMVISLLAMFYLKAPVLLALIMYLPAVPVLILYAINGLFLNDFGKAFNQKVKYRHYTLLFVTQLMYQVVLNAAALWSVVRELRGDNTWHKTSHKGLHRSGSGDSLGEALQPAYSIVAADIRATFDTRAAGGADA